MFWSIKKDSENEKGFIKSCYDLVKWLSHYLYISFLFFFFYLGLTTQKGVRESVMLQMSHSHSHMTGSHMMGYMIGMGK